MSNEQDLPEGIGERAKAPRERASEPTPSLESQVNKPQGDNQEKPTDEKDPLDNPMFGDRHKEEKPTDEKADDVNPDDLKDVVKDVPENQNLFEGFEDDPMVAPSLAWLESAGEGLDIDRAFGLAIDRGDIALIDKKYIQETLGDKAESYTKQAELVFNYTQQKVQERVDAIYEQAGGKEVFTSARDSFNSNADSVVKKRVALALGSGDPDLIKDAVKEIVSFGDKSGTTVRHNDPALGSPSASKGLSKQEYQDIISKERNMSQERYTEVFNLRKLGKQQGL